MVNDKDRIPLTRSLESEVRASYRVETREGLSSKALLNALQDLRPGDQPLDEALHSAGFMPPDADDAPVLHWIDSVFEQWNSHYSLDPELRVIFSNARPLAAAFALQDPRFFTPGGHALHRLMDTLHAGFSGWHSGLGGNSRNALEGARESIERCRRNFNSEPEVDTTIELLSQKINGHAAQLERLDDALIEREIATMSDEIAHIEAAVAINEALETSQVPGSVARFMKSDWFESGKLIAEQSGTHSEAWRSFINTTQLLVDAVQPVPMTDPEGQSRLQATMQHLPGTLSRQLMSLLPDSDAVAGAVGLIEYALLRNMRGEDLGLLSAEPINLRGLPEDGLPSDAELIQEGVIRGRWYRVQSPEGEKRVRMAGSFAANAYLLFMDFLGARALRKSYAEFSQLLKSGEAVALIDRNSFCRAMVEATESQTKVRAQLDHERELAEAEAAAALARDREAAAQAAAAAAREQAEAEDRARAARAEAEAAVKQSASATTETPSSTSGSTSARSEAADDAESGAVPSKDHPYESKTIVKLQLPMGIWMGFHDREPPIMARVAVRDLEKDSYIFTNRDGIKLRELTVAQLIGLIERDMVDFLERKTNFREAIRGMQGVRYEEAARLA